MVKANWDTEELIENWTLLPQELELVKNKVGANQIGFAVLLKLKNRTNKRACLSKIPRITD